MNNFSEETKNVIKGAINEEIKEITLLNDKIYIDLLEVQDIVIYDDGQQCCEARYITTDDDLTAFKGSIFLGIRILFAGDRDDHKYTPQHDDDDAPISHQVQFLIIDTSWGCVVFESHNEHNGYYSGFDVVARNRA